MREPQSLQEAILFFAEVNNCIDYLAVRRWPSGVTCPTCGSAKVKFNHDRRVWQCSSHHSKRQFSIKVGTIFEDSAIGLDKWLTAVWMLVNCKNGVSSYEIARSLTVSQKSAWFMLHRIRLALQNGSFMKMGNDGGEVEADETFIGGRGKNMHKSRKLKLNEIRSAQRQGGVYPGKTAVMGLLDREQRTIRATVIPNVKRDTLQAVILNEVQHGAKVYTDQAASYDILAKHYTHEIVNHMETYVNGRVHTNGLENFWSLLKRGLNGTYVAVEPFHLFRYVDEQAFRYNTRKDGDRKITDAERFDIAISQIAGKRLTFAEVTGKVGETSF